MTPCRRLASALPWIPQIAVHALDERSWLLVRLARSRRRMSQAVRRYESAAIGPGFDIKESEEDRAAPQRCGSAGLTSTDR